MPKIAQWRIERNLQLEKTRLKAAQNTNRIRKLKKLIKTKEDSKNKKIQKTTLREKEEYLTNKMNGITLKGDMKKYMIDRFIPSNPILIEGNAVEVLELAKKFINGLISYKKLDLLCPHIFIGSSCVKYLLKGNYDIYKSHQVFRTGNFRRKGRISENGYSLISKIISCNNPRAQSGFLPFIVASPDFMEEENGRKCLIEVKSSQYNSNSSRLHLSKDAHIQL